MFISEFLFPGIPKHGGWPGGQECSRGRFQGPRPENPDFAYLTPGLARHLRRSWWGSNWRNP